MKFNKISDWENFLSIILITIYLQAGIDKLLDVSNFEVEMRQSPILPIVLIPLLVYLIPILEVAVAFLLFFSSSKVLGYYLSTLIMLLFTSYLLTLVLFYDTSQIPCACGGIFGNVSYGTHIILNVFFFVLSAISLNYMAKSTSKSIGI